MSFPKQSEIELPLLKTLQELGGKAEPKELYPKLAEIFPQLTEEDLTARLPLYIPVAQSRAVESAEARREG
jgi:restriction system protein